MAYYNVPTNNETGGLYEFFRFVAVDATGGLFFPIMLLVIWIVSFLALKNYSTSRAWTFASFFCSVLAIILSVMDYLAPVWMYLAVFLTLIGFIWLKLDRD